MTTLATGSVGAGRGLNVTHMVAVGVLVASLPAQWLVSSVVVGSIQVVPPSAGWQLAPVALVIVVLVGLIVFSATRPDPISGLVRAIGVQALALSGAIVIAVELVVSVLGIFWDAGSGAVRPGAGVWMAAVAGLLLVTVGDRDPMANLLPGVGYASSTFIRLATVGVWLCGLATTIWWTAWRNEPFAEFGPVQVVASTVPVVGTLSFLGVLGCWVALAVALVGRRWLAVTLAAVGCSLLAVSVAAASFAVWAVQILPIDRLLASARSQAIEWSESAEVLESLPDDLAQNLTPTVEESVVNISVQPVALWILLFVTAVSLGLITMMSRRYEVVTSAGVDHPETWGSTLSSGPPTESGGAGGIPRL